MPREPPGPTQTSPGTSRGPPQGRFWNDFSTTFRCKIPDVKVGKSCKIPDVKVGTFGTSNGNRGSCNSQLYLTLIRATMENLIDR